jgi:hypothetical protein
VTQDDPAIAFLNRLLGLSERAPDRKRPASASPNYDGLRRAEAITRFQNQLVAAERGGAVALRYGKRERKHLIERVTVSDPKALARHLGRKPASTTAREAREKLQSLADNANSWVVELLDDIELRWARGEPAYRLESGDVEATSEFLMFLGAIVRDEARGIDARTFSLRVTGDTKTFDRHFGRLLAVLQPHFGESSADAVWKRIGLERFPHPIHLRGPITAKSPDTIAVDGNAKPFASIHPEMLAALEFSNAPTYVLTVENYASFNRQVREVDDGGLVIYTGGFPSAGVVSLLTLVLNKLAETIPFFHWGDIDPGGLRIFRYLEENLPRPPRLHLMDRSLAESHGKSAVRDPALASMAQSDSAVAELALWFSRGEAIKHLEQEALDPASPANNPIPASAAR